MNRTLYTFQGTDYLKSLYAAPFHLLCIDWVTDKGTHKEASGSSLVPAHATQDTISALEAQGYLVESINLA